MSARSSFIWLTNSGQCWKVAFEVYVGLLGMAALLIGLFMLLISFFAGPKAFWLPGGLWALYGLLRIVQHIIVYHCIRCPRRGFNPTRRKTDGRAMHPDILWGRLGGMEACPHCGDRADGMV